MAIETADNKNSSTSPLSVSRRGFLAGTSAAGALVLTANFTSASEVTVEHGDTSQEPEFTPDLFIAIQPNGDVTIMAHRSEMGTGIRTSLPRIVADELDADWERVTVQQAPGDRNYGNQNTDGSNSVRGFFDRMREVGAKARMVLEQAAANQWGVDVSEVKADLHKIVHEASGKQLGYGELVEAANKLEVPKKDLRFKPREAWRYIGKPAKSVDLDDIVTGKAIYGVDARMDNMVYALIKRPPVVGGQVKSFDADKAENMPGVVKIVKLPKYSGRAPAFNQLGGIAVLAESTWQAWQAKDAIKVEWDHGSNQSYDTKDYKDELKKSIGKDGRTVRKVGDAAKVLNDAETKFSVGYSVPHLAHAPMEVPAAVASVELEDGKPVSCHILASTQNPQAVQGAVARALKINDPGKIKVEVTLLGSGFGRKSKPDYCVEAALLSAEAGRPVHVMFTREDDIRHDYYHTMSEMSLEAAVDNKGMPTAWRGRVAYPSIGSTFNPGNMMPGGAGQGFQDIPFEIPNIQVEICRAKGHVRIGWLRAVNHIHQNFAVSCFVDELAHHAGRNPKDYLLELLGEDRNLSGPGIQAGPKFPYDIGRLKSVTRRVAELADWDARFDKMPKGKGIGIACARSFLSYAAHVFEVEVNNEGKLTVNKVWVVLDAGTVVSPDRVKAQMEGTIAMTMGQAMFGRISFANGRCEQSNYDSYKMVTMEHYPREIVTEIVESDGPPAGVGESTVASAAPALCNAIFAATGKRVRDLPLEDHDLSWS